MDLAAALRSHLDAETAVTLALLFGSRAHGKERAGSDLDLGLASAPEAGRAERNRVLDRIERAVRLTIDMIDLDEAPPLLRMEIARTGVIVAARSPDAWASFRARAMLDWGDFAPYARRMHDAARARVQRARHGPR
jgi:predicted nucleotidyltransferase